MNINQNETPDQRRIRELEAQLAQNQNGGPVRFQVGKSGGLSMYGLGQRFPITLYVEGWEILLAHVDEIRAALVAYDRELKRKA